MDTSDATTADLSPLEQRRARLRAYTDRVLEAIEDLPMPKTPLEGERTMRAITASDRTLLQLYTRVSRSLTLSHADVGTRRLPDRTSGGPSSANRLPTRKPTAKPPLAMTPSASPMPESPRTAPIREEDTPFVYIFDDEDNDPEPEEDIEPLSANAQAALDLEKQCNDIYLEYLAGLAEISETATPPTTGPPRISQV